MELLAAEVAAVGDTVPLSEEWAYTAVPLAGMLDGNLVEAQQETALVGEVVVRPPEVQIGQ